MALYQTIIDEVRQHDGVYVAPCWVAQVLEQRQRLSRERDSL